MELRDYQQRGIDTIERLISQGKRRVLTVAPTGAGKGTMAVSMLDRTAKAGGKAVFVVHRREIVYDIQKRLEAVGVQAGLVMSDAKPARDRPIQLASIQALLHERRVLRPDLLVVDEAHHYAADEWRGVLTRVKPYATVGFTATPQRADGRPLGDMFDYLVDLVSHSELLSRGDIVPCKVLRPACPLGSDLADEAADAMVKYAPGQRAFVFVRSLSHAAETCDKLNARGVRAAVVDERTNYKRRHEIMQDMRAGKLDAIVNFFTMTEGIDIADVTCVVIARSVSHEAAYMQMVGRALRAHPGKTEATVLDLTGASYVHGLPLDNRVYALKSRGIKRQGADVREHRRRVTSQPPDVLNMELVEATQEQQLRWGRRRIDWSKVGLGERSDADIARELGTSDQLVGKIRREKGIPVCPPTQRLPIDWSTVDLAHRSSASLARELGVHEDTIKKARTRLGIVPVYRGRGMRVQVDWNTLPLGKVSDQVLAKQLGVSSSTVHMHRTRRGIPPIYCTTEDVVDWDSQPLGVVTDGVLAQRLSVEKTTVRRQREQRGIAPVNPRNPSYSHVLWAQVGLGERDDAEIARELGCTRWTVRSARHRLGIKPKKPKGWQRTPTKVDWDREPLLGKVPDEELAAKHGVHQSTVRNARLLRDLPSVRKSGRPSKQPLKTRDASADRARAARSESAQASASSV